MLSKERMQSFLERGHPCLFFVYFRSLQTNFTILQQINVKNVHPEPVLRFEPTTS